MTNSRIFKQDEINDTGKKNPKNSPEAYLLKSYCEFDD